MKFKNFQQQSNKNNNTGKSVKPYDAYNNIVKKSEILFAEKPPVEKTPAQEQKPVEAPVPAEQKPVEAPVPTKEEPKKVETGYIAVGVFTALGALPVPGAVVTIYTANQGGEEHVIYQLITDENGRVPTVELPVIYNPSNPLESSKYYFTTYNMRVQAINYYTVNIIDIRVFPNITTSYRIDLIPAIPGPSTEHPEQTIVIPPSPIDKSNE